MLGNLALRQAAILPANYAVEEAGSRCLPIRAAPLIPDIRIDTPASNYYAEHSQAAGWD